MVKQGEKGSLKGRVWKGRSVVRGLEGKVRGRPGGMLGLIWIQYGL